MAVVQDQEVVPVPRLSLLALRVSEPGEIQADGFYYLSESVRPDEVTALHAWLRGGSTFVKGTVSREYHSPLPNLLSKDAGHDLAHAAFTLTFESVAELPPESYDVVVGIELPHVCVFSTFSLRYERGSAGALGGHHVGSGVTLVPAWDRRNGLRVAVVPDNPALNPNGVTFTGAGCSLEIVSPDGFVPRHARWSSGVRGPALQVVPDPERHDVATVRFDAASIVPRRFAKQAVGIEIVGADGGVRLVHSGHEHVSAEWPVPGSHVIFAPDREGVLRLIPTEPRCAAEALEVVEEGRALLVRGRHLGMPPSFVMLSGARVEARGAVVTPEPNEFECRLPLHATGWLGQDRIVPSGKYTIDVHYADGRSQQLAGSRSLDGALPLIIESTNAHLRFERGGAGQLSIDISAPLNAGEVGLPGLKSVTAPGRRGPIVKDALYLESWFGKSFSDNPAPLADALREDFADIYVGVVDRSVELPEHVTGVVMGSSAWWDAASTSRVVVNNSWLPKYFKRRKGQHVVQTWHGTPLKKLGFDRSQHEGRASTPKSFAWGSSKWDLLVSPNAYSTEIFRRAYAYDGEIAEIGYPRNDILVTGDDVRTKVRAGLGIADTETVVLYAPTFRESQRGRSTFCDVEALARKLGSGFRLLVRGHSATLRTGADHRASNVLDVTSYPDSSHMLAIADVLVTDYSSVMFDFTATRRPIVFFTPDIDEYINDGRGVYFDLDTQAPGPVVRSERSLPGAIRRAWKDRAVESAKYDAWFEKFNSNDDGGATERLAAIVREW